MQLELPLSAICGQLLIGGFYGTELPASFAKALARKERGGAILFKRNFLADDLSQITGINASLRDACAPDLPPLIGIDQEGGRVARLSAPVLEIPPMRELGRAGRVDLVYRAARTLGSQLRGLGFTMNFAPVLDVNTCDENPIIGDRAFGSDPRIVVRFGVAFVRGLQDGGILACGKHFPGHGDTSKDSHHDLPVIHHDRARLEQVELLPFRAAAGAGVAAFMTAHVVYEAFDAGIPATLSRAINASLLRAEIGFEGALLSDDLEMKAIALRYSIEDAAVEAVWAGCDALLICSDEELQERAHAALVTRAERDVKFRARCVEAAERGLRIRRAVRPEPLSRDSILALVHAPSAVALAKELASSVRLPS